jgi:arginine decarboxylase
MFPSPTRVFLTKGVGVHRFALTAFEFALRDADIEQQNLVYVSSILPPRCQVITREEGVELLQPGDITFCVMARSETNEFGRHLYASLGLAKPADPDMYGYISELHGYGMTAEASGEQAEDLAATMLASTLGLDFDPEAAWNERRQIYEHSNLIIDSTSITAAAVCGPNNHWTCAIAAAVFLFSSSCRVSTAHRNAPAARSGSRLWRDAAVDARRHLANDIRLYVNRDWITAVCDCSRRLNG